MEKRPRKPIPNVFDQARRTGTIGGSGQPPAPETYEPTSQPQSTQPEEPTVQENNNTILLENNNIVKKEKRKRKTDERDAKMYYLDPGQTDKLDDLRREYKQRTGKKLSEQDFMRHIINCLTIDPLL